MATLTKAQLQQANKILDEKCQDLQDELALTQFSLEDSMQEIKTLKGIISLVMMANEESSKIIKLQKPKPMHIMIENDFCTITMGDVENEAMLGKPDEPMH